MDDSQSRASIDPLAAAHTAEHVLSAVMQRDFGTGRSLETHLSAKKSKCDYRVKRPLGEADVRSIEAAVNAEIARDLLVTSFVVDRAEAESHYDMGKVPEGAEAIRIVRIGDLDIMPCVGSHVERTSELGRFVIRSATMKSDRVVRIRYALMPGEHIETAALCDEEPQVLSFDIEISDVFELGVGEDFETYAPFHISVAATVVREGDEVLWYSENEDGSPALNIMRQRARELLEYLSRMQDAGYMVCAWNGLGFDLRWIGHNAGDMRTAAKVARRIYDPMFQFFNQRGFPVGLSAVAEGLGIGQTKLMSGADAPVAWRVGHHERVMDYVVGDCRMTNEIVMAIQRAGCIRWVTSQGRVKSEPMERLKTAEEVIQDPGPDQGWMDRPIDKASFYSWFPE